MRSSALDPLWQEWLALHQRLSEQHRDCATEGVAGVFPGYKPDGFERHTTRLLYVGKATEGSFDPDLDPAASLTDGTLERQRALAKVCFDRTQGGFWQFAESLSLALGCDDRSNIAWSNLCKIGTCSGNPSDDLVAVQQDLAIRTLQAEIKEYQPTVAVFVSNQFAQQVLLGALGNPPDESWNKSEEDSQCKSRMYGGEKVQPLVPPCSGCVIHNLRPLRSHSMLVQRPVNWRQLDYQIDY